MNYKKLTLIVSFLAIYIFTGCASKQEEQEYNKPAVYWYNKMIKQIANYQLDEADDTYTSLESEHRNSPLIPGAILIIAKAHMDNEEYAMANYYLDEYLKRFSLKSDADYIRYLKIKSNFMAFKQQFREQDLLMQTLEEVDKFTKEYKESQYIYLVQSIKARLLMAKSKFDKEISDLYGRIDKPQAQKIYGDKSKQSWEDQKSIENVNVPWYRWVFE